MIRLDEMREDSLAELTRELADIVIISIGREREKCFATIPTALYLSVAVH